MPIPLTSAAIRRVAALVVVLGFTLIALRASWPSPSSPTTPRARAETAAVEYLFSIGWFQDGLGMSHTAEAERSADGGWRVFVDESGLLQDEYGSHCLIELDENYEVVLYFGGA